jgi:hypothetical protein
MDDAGSMAMSHASREPHDRNLNPWLHWRQLGQAHRPRLSWPVAGEGGGQTRFDVWQRDLLPRVLVTLGPRPDGGPLNPLCTARWEEGGLIKERWLIDVQAGEAGLSAALLLFRPADLRDGERRPAILCCHGHNREGKKDIMGVPYLSEGPRDPRKVDYGLELAKAGFVTYAIDWLGFGERAYEAKPHFYSGLRNRDRCNVMYLCATLLGRTVLGSNLHDAQRATDFVCEQPYVDAERLGVMGLSLGGTMTTWVSLYDQRVKAANVICYNGPFFNIAFDTYQVCGSQITPGLFDLCDVGDLQGLIAPRPLLMEIGLHDTIFRSDHTLAQYRQTQTIYEAAGAGDRLELDLFPGEHGWGGRKSAAFFRRRLHID